MKLMSEKVLQEFTGITNDQAYVKVFSKRMMLPVPNKLGEFFGTDQRKYILPYIKHQLDILPKNGQIFDVGAGAGDVVDFALKDAPEGTVVNIEEPNPGLIKEYLKRIKDHPYLKIGTVYEGPIQDYYLGKKQGIYPKPPQNLVLAIHMIYHLTNFTNPLVNPEADLIYAISFLYGLLAPTGTLLIIYADLLDRPNKEAVCGLAEKFFRYKYPDEPFADNLRAIYKARNQLLGPDGSVCNALIQRYPHTKPKLVSERSESHFFGKTIEDIAVLAHATELCPSNSEEFDIAKLQFCLDYISKYPERIGLQKEEKNVPQKGMWRANEPQIVAAITKES
jgi:hypothetical protein